MNINNRREGREGLRNSSIGSFSPRINRVLKHAHLNSTLTAQNESHRVVSEIAANLILSQTMKSEEQFAREGMEQLQETRPRFSAESGYLKFYHTPSNAKNVLREQLLPGIRDERLQNVSQSDISKMLEFCLYRLEELNQGDLKFDHAKSRRLYQDIWKTRVLCFRIFHYLAELNWELPQEVVHMLVLECNDLHPKTLPYVVMALGYTIYRYPRSIEKVIEDISIEKLIDSAIERLTEIHLQKFIEPIVIALAAKAKLGHQLNPSQLQLIEQALTEFDEPIEEAKDPEILPLTSHQERRIKCEEIKPIALSLDPKSLKLVKGEISVLQLLTNEIKPLASSDLGPLYHPFRFNPNYVIEPRGFGPFWSRSSYINTKKTLIKRRGILSEKSLMEIFSCYDFLNSEQMNNKILQLIVYAVANGRWGFNQASSLIQILGRILTCAEFKFRSQAHILANSLLVNGKYVEELKKLTFQGSFRQRRYALSSIYNDIKQGKNQKVFNSQKRFFLEKIEEASRKFGHSIDERPIRELIYAIQIRLNRFEGSSDNLENFISLLYHPNYSTEVTKRYLEIAKQKKKISSGILKAISDFVKVPLTENTMATFCNAIAILRYAIENGEDQITGIEEAFSVSMMRLADTYLESTPVDIKKELLIFIGVSLHLFFQEITNHHLIDKIDCCVNDEKLFSGSIFVLSRWLDKESSVENIQIAFGRLLPKLMNAMPSLSTNVLENCLEIIEKAAVNGVNFSTDIVDQLISMAKASQDPSYQYRILRTVIICLKYRPEVTPWNKDLFQFLYDLSIQENEMNLSIGSLLCEYIDIFDAMTLDKLQEKLFKLVSDRNTFPIGIGAFHRLVMKKCFIRENYCYKLAKMMIRDSDEISRYCASLLEEISKNLDLSEDVIKMIIQGLSSSDTVVVNGCLNILSIPKNILEIKKDEIRIKKFVFDLMKIINSILIDQNIRKTTYNLLISLSDTFSLSFEQLQELVALVQDKDRSIQLSSLQLLALQLINKGKYIEENQSDLFHSIKQLSINFLNDDSLQLYAIDLLCSLNRLGYSLEQQCIERVATSLYIESSERISNMIYTFLEATVHKTNEGGEETGEKSLSVQIFTMQRIERTLRENPQFSSEDKSKLIESLIPLVVDGVLLLPILQHRLKVILDFDRSEELLSSIFTLCQAMINHSIDISPSLLLGICTIPIVNLKTEHQFLQSLILSQALVLNPSITRLAFPIIEKGFLDTSLIGREAEIYFRAFRIVVKRGHSIQWASIDRLCELFFKTGIEEKAIPIEVEEKAIRILRLILECDLEKFDNHGNALPIEKLVSLTQNSTSTRLKGLLNLLIGRLTSPLVKTKKTSTSHIFNTKQDLLTLLDVDRSLKMTLDEIEPFFENLQNLLSRGLSTPEGIVTALGELWLNHSSREVRRKVFELLGRFSDIDLVGNKLKRLLQIENERKIQEQIKLMHEFVQKHPIISVETVSTLLLFFESNATDAQNHLCSQIISIFDKTKFSLMLESGQQILDVYANRFFDDISFQNQFLTFFYDVFHHKLFSERIRIDFLEKIFREFERRQPQNLIEMQLLHFLVKHGLVDQNEDFHSYFNKTTILIKDISLKKIGLVVYIDYLVGASEWSSNVLEILKEFSSEENLNLIEDLHSFVIGDPRYRVENEEILKMREREKNEPQLKAKLLSALKSDDNPPPTEEQLQRLWSCIESHDDIYRRRLLYQTLFRSFDHPYTVDQFIDLVAMISFLIPNGDTHLFRSDFEMAQSVFFETLLLKFDFFNTRLNGTKMTIEIRSLFTSLKVLKWTPEDICEFFNRLPKNTDRLKLTQLFEVINNFEIPLKKVKEIASDSEFLVDRDEFDVPTLRFAMMEHLLKETFETVIGVDISERSKLCTQLMITSALTLAKHNWDFKKLIDYLQERVKDTNIDDITHLIGFLAGFQKKISEKDFYQLANSLFAIPIREVLQRLQDFVLKRHLVKSKNIKNLNELLDELFSERFNQRGCNYGLQVYEEELAAGEERVEGLKGEIKACFKEMNRLYDMGKSDGSNGLHKPINVWTEEDIQQWALTHRRNSRFFHSGQDSSSSELQVGLFHSTEGLSNPSAVLAILKRASMIVFNYEPHLTQLLAVYMLSTEHSPSMLAEVSTGEGKSHIIAMLATIKALNGKSVDVITSSPELVKRDVNNYRRFYSLFRLKVDHNLDQKDSIVLKSCYDSEIVYGDPSNFQFDLLNDKKGFETRGKREFETAIIDEVDNVLIEGNQTTAQLASPTPGMQELTPLLIILWDHLDLLNSEWEKSDVFREISEEEITLQLGMKSLWIQGQLSDYIIKKVTKRSLYIPNHLKHFVISQAKYWAHSAYTAYFELKLEFHYDIVTDSHGVKSIAIIDFANTGVIQIGTSWEKGLHQFLQIKHGLTVEPLNLVTHYSSVLSYVGQYRDRIGLTGTLGSHEVRQLYYETYGFRSFKVPTSFERRQLKLRPNILNNEKLWIEAITRDAYREAHLFGRVVLIVCESKIKAKAILKYLEQYFGVDAEQYLDDKNENNDFLSFKHSKKTIIVATNLAGRGTDLTVTKEVLKAGGLHVCVTFLPINSRVQEQAFGRTSRRGEPGTVQLVLNDEELKKQLSNPQDLLDLRNHLKSVEKLREEQEAEDLRNFKKTRLLEIGWGDALYRGYLNFLDEVKGEDQDITGPKSLLPSAVFRRELKKMKVEALQEEWGMWIREHGEDKGLIEDFDRRRKIQLEENLSSRSIEGQGVNSQSIPIFEVFKKDMLHRYRSGMIIENPIYYIRLGHQLIEESKKITYVFSKNTFIEKAIWAYNQAIMKDVLFAYHAYYHKAYALILLRQLNYKQNAQRLLNLTIKRIERGPLSLLNEALSAVATRYSSLDRPINNHLIEYLRAETQALLRLIQLSQESIHQIEESFKFVSIHPAVPCFSPLTFKDFTAEEADQWLTSQSDSESISICFNHLKTHYDLGPRSQIANTIEAITKSKKEYEFTLTFDSEKLYSSKGKEHSLKTLLPINRYHIKKYEKIQVLDDPLAIKERSSSSPAQQEHSENKIVFLGDVLEKWRLNGVRIGGKILQVMSSPFKSTARWGVENWQKVQDIYNAYKETENIQVTLTLRHLTVNDIQTCLKQFCQLVEEDAVPPDDHLEASEDLSIEMVSLGSDKYLPIHQGEVGNIEDQIFDIGPIVLSEELLKDLQIHSLDLDVVIFMPPKLKEGEEGSIHSQHIFDVTQSEDRLQLPKKMTVLELDATHVGAEVSFVHCTMACVTQLLDFVPEDKIEEKFLTLVLHHVNQDRANRFMTVCRYSMTLRFVLDEDQALKIARLTSDEHNQAILSLEGIHPSVAKEVISLADRVSQELALTCYPIDEELLRIFNDPLFVLEHRLNGYNLFFDAREQLPLPVRSLILLSTWSAAEIAGGVSLALFTLGFGASIGKGFVCEGIFGFMRVVGVISKRNFNLSSFLSEKAISYALIFITAGISSGVANSARKGEKAVVAAMRVISQSPDGASSQQVFKNFIELFQKTTTYSAKKVTRGIVTKAISTTTENVLKNIQGDIENEVEGLVRAMFNKSHWKDNLRFMFALDRFNSGAVNVYSEKFCNDIKIFINRWEREGVSLSIFRKKILSHFEAEFAVMIHRMESNKQEELKQLIHSKETIDLEVISANWELLWKSLSDQKLEDQLSQAIQEELRDQPELLRAYQVMTKFKACLANNFTKEFEDFQQEIIDLFTRQYYQSIERVAWTISGVAGRAVIMGLNEGIDALSDLAMNEISTSLQGKEQQNDGPADADNPDPDEGLEDIKEELMEGEGEVDDDVLELFHSSLKRENSSNYHHQTHHESTSHDVHNRQHHLSDYQNHDYHSSKEQVIENIYCGGVLCITEGVGECLINEVCNSIHVQTETVLLMLRHISIERGREYEFQFGKLKFEQAKLIKGLIGLVMISGIKIEGGRSVEEKREQIEIDKCFNDLMSNPSAFFQMLESRHLIRTSDREYLSALKRAWDHFQHFDQFRNKAWNSLINPMDSSQGYHTLFDRCAEFGAVMQLGHTKPGVFAAGVLIEQIGFVIRGAIKIKKTSDQAKLRLKYIAMTIMREGERQYSEMFKEVLNLTRQSQEIAEHVVANLTEIAGMITDHYKEFLVHLINQAIEVDDKDQYLKVIERLEKDFLSKKKNLDARVQKKTELFANHVVTEAELKSYIAASSNSIEKLIQLTRDIATKNPQEIERVVKIQYDESRQNVLGKGKGLINSGNDCFFNAVAQLILNSDLKHFFSDRKNLSYFFDKKFFSQQQLETVYPQMRRDCINAYEFFERLSKDYQRASRSSGICQYSHRELRRILKLDIDEKRKKIEETSTRQWDCVEAFQTFCRYYHLEPVASCFETRVQLDLSKSIKLRTLTTGEAVEYSKIDAEGFVIDVKAEGSIVQLLNLAPDLSMQEMVNQIFQRQEVESEYKYVKPSHTPDHWELWSTQHYCKQLLIEGSDLKHDFMLHVQRFKYNAETNKFEKNSNHLPDDLFEIKLKTFRYVLIGFVVHEGLSPNYGHYFSFIRMRGGWMKWDDSRGKSYLDTLPQEGRAHPISSSSSTVNVDQAREIAPDQEVIEAARQAYFLHYIRLSD